MFPPPSSYAQSKSQAFQQLLRESHVQRFLHKEKLGLSHEVFQWSQQNIDEQISASPEAFEGNI